MFVCLLSYCYRSGKEQTKIRDRVLLNKLRFQGEVLDVKTSGNHSFGILLLKLDYITIGEFSDTLLKNGIYPYKMKDGKAELYAGISTGIQKGDKVIVDSDKKKAFYYYIKDNKHCEGDFGVITNPFDIDYVKKNSAFK